MAAGPWQIFTRAKRNLCTAATGINLDGVFKMCLLTSAASAALLGISNTGASAWSEFSAYEIGAAGGYVANGKSLSAVKWTVGATTKQMKFSFTTAGVVFTASASALTAIRYAVIRNSISAGGGKVLCFCTLSTSPFNIAVPNTLTILPAATGVFTLA